MPLWILGVLLVIFIVETVLSEMEEWGWATVTLITTIVVAHFLNVFQVTDFVASNGLNTLLYVLGYLAIGVVWSFIKWFSYLRAYRDLFRECKQAFCKTITIDAANKPVLLDPNEPIPAAQMKAFKNYLANNSHLIWNKNYSRLSSLERPRAAKSKSLITAWMAYWPCSVVGTILNDPVRRAFNWLFNSFKALYQRMEDYVFRADVELK